MAAAACRHSCRGLCRGPCGSTSAVWTALSATWRPPTGSRASRPPPDGRGPHQRERASLLRWFCSARSCSVRSGTGVSTSVFIEERIAEGKAEPGGRRKGAGGRGPLSREQAGLGRGTSEGRPWATLRAPQVKLGKGWGSCLYGLARFGERDCSVCAAEPRSGAACP